MFSEETVKVKKKLFIPKLNLDTKIILLTMGMIGIII